MLLTSSCENTDVHQASTHAAQESLGPPPTTLSASESMRVIGRFCYYQRQATLTLCAEFPKNAEPFLFNLNTFSSNHILSSKHFFRTETLSQLSLSETLLSLKAVDTIHRSDLLIDIHRTSATELTYTYLYRLPGKHDCQDPQATIQRLMRSVEPTLTLYVKLENHLYDMLSDTCFDLYPDRDADCDAKSDLKTPPVD